MKQSIFVKTLVAAAIGLLALACTKTEDDAEKVKYTSSRRK